MGARAISQLPATSGLTIAAWLEITELSTTVTMTANTISADGDDNSYNDSGGAFITEGFTVGMRVNVTGFTGDAANNIFSGVITALTADKMTIGGTDGDIIVDDAAGEAVTISAWQTRRANVEDISRLAGFAAAEANNATSYDMVAADAGKYIRMINAAPKSVNVRPNADEALPNNAEWHYRNVGAADLTFVPGTGVTINPPAGGTLVVSQGATVTLKRVAADEFDLFGQTVAAP